MQGLLSGRRRRRRRRHSAIALLLWIRRLRLRLVCRRNLLRLLWLLLLLVHGRRRRRAARRGRGRAGSVYKREKSDNPIHQQAIHACTYLHRPPPRANGALSASADCSARCAPAIARPTSARNASVGCYVRSCSSHSWYWRWCCRRYSNSSLCCPCASPAGGYDPLCWPYARRLRLHQRRPGAPRVGWAPILIWPCLSCF